MRGIPMRVVAAGVAAIYLSSCATLIHGGGQQTVERWKRWTLNTIHKIAARKLHCAAIKFLAYNANPLMPSIIVAKAALARFMKSCWLAVIVAGFTIGG
jgi:hypothetical protein